MRLIDLRCDWALQYAAESTQYDPADYPEIPTRVPRLDGYLTRVRLAVLSCRRSPDDWARRDDPWRDLDAMIARYEAEFAGRILARPADVDRWRAEPRGGLAWGVLSLVGLAPLLRAQTDLDRLPALFSRGARLFGAVAGDLGRPFLERLLDLAPETEGPRPAIDLADVDPSTAADILDWFEADPARLKRLPRLHSAVRPDTPTDLIRRLREHGATLGATPTPTADAFRETLESLAALPHPGSAWEGIAIAADPLGIAETAPEFANAGRLSAWIATHFPGDVARALAFENARRLLLTTAGC